jgi:hypothetical protein
MKEVATTVKEDKREHGGPVSSLNMTRLRVTEGSDKQPGCGANTGDSELKKSGPQNIE